MPPQGSHAERIPNGTSSPENIMSVLNNERVHKNDARISPPYGQWNDDLSGVLTSDICGTHGNDDWQACTANDTGSQAHRKQEAQTDLAGLASVKPQYGGNGKKEDPHVRGKIGDIREVAEGNQVHTWALCGSPPGLDGPALETEHHLHGDEP